MAEKHYVGEIGTVIMVDCGTDISTAINTKLKVIKPDKTTTVEWNATIDGTNNLKYTSVAGDFDQAGRYELYASLTYGGWTGLGDEAEFFIDPNPFT